MNYLILAAISMMFPTAFVIGSLLDENHEYAILVHEVPVSEYYFSSYFELKPENEKTIRLGTQSCSVEIGTIQIFDFEYKVIDDWNCSFHNNGKLLIFTGNAESFDGNLLYFFAIGKLIQETNDGPMYEFNFHIHPKDSDLDLDVPVSTLLVDLGEQSTKPKISYNTTHANEHNLLLLTEHTHHQYKARSYAFTVKLYNESLNPLQDFFHKDGRLAGANVTVDITTLSGDTIKSFQGQTDRFGLFDGDFLLDDTIKPGKYVVEFTASYYESNVTDAKPFFVFEEKEDVDIRTFRPIFDIEQGHWQDVKGGNKNQKLYDEVNEFLRNDDNYVNSRDLSPNQNADTWETLLATDFGVTADHTHYIKYTYKKDASGGNPINLTVRLLDGDNEIVRWVHPDIGSEFVLATQTLTKDQTASLSGYSDLRLEFTGDCFDCTSKKGSDKREVRISWVQMIV